MIGKQIGVFFGRVLGFLLAVVTIILIIVAIKAGNALVVWVPAIILGILSFCFFGIANDSKKNVKCPQCGKEWALEVVVRQYVDSMRTSRNTNNGTKYGNKIIENVAYKCKYCGKALMRQETRYEWDD